MHPTKRASIIKRTLGVQVAARYLRNKGYSLTATRIMLAVRTA